MRPAPLDARRALRAPVAASPAGWSNGVDGGAPAVAWPAAGAMTVPVVSGAVVVGCPAAVTSPMVVVGAPPVTVVVVVGASSVTVEVVVGASPETVVVV